MKEYSINTLYLTQISELGELKQFAQWLYYKSLFKKGCAFNYTDQAFADKIGKSVSMARIYRQSWIEKGWCRFHKGHGKSKNLIFNSARNSVRGEKWHKTIIKIYGTLSETINNLYYSVLENRNNQFEYLKRVGQAIHKPDNSKHYKWGIKRRKKLASDRLPSTTDTFKASYKGLGKLFGCSSGKAHSLIKSFTEQKELTVIRGFTQMAGTSSKMGLKMLAESKAGTFVSRNYVYRVFCNQYVFS